MKVLTITTEEKRRLLAGGVVKVNGVAVVLDTNGKPCECVSSNHPYPAVIPSILRPADTLNLTDSETIALYCILYSKKQDIYAFMRSIRLQRYGILFHIRNILLTFS